MDNSYTAFLNDTLSTISSGYLLCDATGVCIMPADQAGKHVFSVNDISASEEYTKIGDMTVFKVDVAPRLYLALYSKDDSGVDVGKMACAYIKAALNVQNKEMSKERFYAMTVMQKLSIADTNKYIHRYHVSENKDRYCIIIRCGDNVEDMEEVLHQIFSESQCAAVYMLNRTTMLLVINKSDDIKSADDMELAQAIVETAREIGCHDIKVGVGEVRRSIYKLYESYDEAAHAISLGDMFDIQGNVFVYRQLIIERIISSIPDDVCRYFYNMMFNKRNSRLLSDDMQRTIEMICNLNLSEAARDIYIHRNTLVYRLDKLQYATGLDLRVFDDAATFKLIMLLGKRIKAEAEQDAANNKS